MRNRPLNKWRDKDRANSTAGENYSERESSALVKPREHGARIRKLRGSVRDQSQHKKCEIELPDVWSESAERSERQCEDQDRRQYDAPRREAIEQKSNAGRNQSDGDRRERESAADGFPLPSERSVERIQEEAERVRDDGSKAHHHSCKRGGHHAPSSVVAGTLVDRFRSDCLAHCPAASSSTGVLARYDLQCTPRVL